MNISKQDLEYLMHVLADRYDLDLNYSSYDSIDCQFTELHKYPFRGKETELYVREAHSMFRKLKAIHEGQTDSVEDEARQLLRQAMSKLGW